MASGFLRDKKTHLHAADLPICGLEAGIRVSVDMSIGDGEPCLLIGRSFNFDWLAEGPKG